MSRLLVASLLSASLAGCVAEEAAPAGAPGETFQARAEILDIRCARFADRIELTGAFDVSLDVGQTFEVNQFTTIHLGRVDTVMECGTWRSLEATGGCDRVADMPDNERIDVVRVITLPGSLQPRNIQLDIEARAVTARGTTAASDLVEVSCALP